MFGKQVTYRVDIQLDHQVNSGVNETVSHYEASKLRVGPGWRTSMASNYLLALLPAFTFDTLVEKRHLGD